MAANKTFAWAVIGAGPAGIATIGKLLDQGIAANKIAWIDPEFKAGDFGSKWRCVSSNTKAGLFTRFLQNCQSFDYNRHANDFALNQLDPDKTCQLLFMTEPLQWLTEKFQQQVFCLQDSAHAITLTQRQWLIALSQKTIQAKNVVLATGSEPKILDYPGLELITLQQVLDTNQLALNCKPTDTVAVFGSSHSAIIAIRNLLNRPVERVINFYRAPLRYAVYFDDWILFDDTGLKGTTADWARENIDGQLPQKLERVLSTEAALSTYLPRCNKVVYAIGFEARKTPIIESFPSLPYNDRSGIIAPGLFGLGIAFPEANVDRFGNLEYRVGLWKFMDYLNRTMPVWLKYPT